MKYDWDKIIAELPEGSGRFGRYPGDDGTDDPATQAVKAADYADWVYAKAERAGARSMIETRQKKRSLWSALFG